MASRKPLGAAMVAVTLAITASAYWGTNAGAAIKPRHVCVVYDLLIHGKQILAARPLAVVPCPGAGSTSAGAA